MRIFWHALIFILASGSTHALKQESKPWDVLESCQLVDAKINDGDSFLIRSNGEEYIFRLYYVDTPESYSSYPERLSDQARYFSVTNEQVLAAGKKASAFSKKFLAGNFTVITQWADARGGSTPRYFALIQKNEQLLSTELVRQGLARIYGMPIQQRWPGGVGPQTYLQQLKRAERAAQSSFAGIWGDAQNSQQNQVSQQTETTTPASQTKLAPTINLNNATADELETLPGIGPTLAAAIIAARPFEQIDALTAISGISDGKLADFRDRITLSQRPISSDDIDYYRAQPERHLNQTISVRVAALANTNSESPAGFRAVQLVTGSLEESGGTVIAFIPEEFYARFVQHYDQHGRIFSGTLHRHQGQLILVYTRN